MVGMGEALMEFFNFHPCPFKHTTVPDKPAESYIKLQNVTAEKHWVACTWCGATGPMKQTPQEAVQLWNSASEQPRK